MYAIFRGFVGSDWLGDNSTSNTQDDDVVMP